MVSEVNLLFETGLSGPTSFFDIETKRQKHVVSCTLLKVIQKISASSLQKGRCHSTMCAKTKFDLLTCRRYFMT